MPQTFDLNRNHFELFGITPRFALDLDALSRAYRELQSEVHPDRFAHLSDAEQRAAMQWATHVNGAYQTLKSPQARAKYLLELSGAAVDEHAGAGLPSEFLMEQMEWREKAEAAREHHNSEELSVLERESEAGLQQCYTELETALDREHDLAAARLALFRLMFLDKLRDEIGDALEAIETAS
jgi:molecular chaperone HscB